MDSNAVIDMIEKIKEDVAAHRSGLVACPRSCWCWDLESAQTHLEIALEAERNIMRGGEERGE